MKITTQAPIDPKDIRDERWAMVHFLSHLLRRLRRGVRADQFDRLLELADVWVEFATPPHSEEHQNPWDLTEDSDLVRELTEHFEELE